MTRRLVAALITILGGCLIVAGVAVVFWPAALVLAGLLVMAGGLFGIPVAS